MPSRHEGGKEGGREGRKDLPAMQRQNHKLGKRMLPLMCVRFHPPSHTNTSTRDSRKGGNERRRDKNQNVPALQRQNHKLRE